MIKRKMLFAAFAVFFAAAANAQNLEVATVDEGGVALYFEKAEKKADKIICHFFVELNSEKCRDFIVKSAVTDKGKTAGFTGIKAAQKIEVCGPVRFSLSVDPAAVYLMLPEITIGEERFLKVIKFKDDAKEFAALAEAGITEKNIIDARLLGAATGQGQAEEGQEENSAGPDIPGFEEMAMGKAEDLGGYIQLIGNKNTPWQDSKRAIDLAMGLFSGEKSQIEIINKNTGKKTSYNAREYLEKIKMLKYEQVEIEWVAIKALNSFTKQADGSYARDIEITQRFKAVKDGQTVYEDSTVKIAMAVLKKGEIDKTEKEDIWLLRFNGIKVVEVR